ncbi:putative essential cytoplasmic protein Ctr86 [Cladophialophora carrionii]|uniref:Ataxin-10 homolog n=1 Tax=Cladophialophora carrionii TaxID=86049 RepID=A0A1C1CCQ4_9EURO|nr:putative essential cytoplasmic protein Ctr86 [Cladophialophora carrionii]
MSATLLLQLVLTGTLTHYESRGLIDDKRLEHLLIAGKQILYKSHQESDVRSQLGFNPRIWHGLTKVLAAAIPVLEQQSFSYKNPPNLSYGGSSSELIAAHYPSLVKDIERLNDLCTIARNLLATTKRAQNLAAEKAFDQQILKLIDVCVKVTARGFDGEANPRNEERWQKVVNLYKRLLITCLQFLHNFIMHNEQRKLVLWLDLFGQSQARDVDDLGRHSPDLRTHDQERDQAAKEDRVRSTVENLPDRPGQVSVDGGNLGYNIDDVHALFDLMSTNKEPDEQTQMAAKVLMDKIRSDMEHLSGMNANQLDDSPDVLLRVGAELRAWLLKKEDSATVAAHSSQIKRVAEKIMALTHGNGSKTNDHAAPRQTKLPIAGSYGGLKTSQVLTEDDMRMPRTAKSAAATLQEAKDELMARLHEAPIMDENGEPEYDDEGDPEDDEDLEDDDDLISVGDSMGDEDYQGSADQERGLLTDVPLVLGPTEIEALPMIIQAGIVDNFGSKNGAAAQQQGPKTNMQAVRCHILLAQEAGRNVLRELLIFIAAWDLPDDEFYFKMMVQIMEAILKNGLMSHAYSDFGQPKDIISPAQAVVIKILTHIFRAKYSPASVQQQQQQQQNSSIEESPAPQQGKPRPIPSALSRVDVLTVRYIFIVFRGNIIPETCALIYLQGQIRAGLALAEDFPLNLWDMERVYEGVYQFLEFFAVLTENNDWKKLLVQWEIVYDLVTLIKELDQSIAKVGLTQAIPARTANGDKATLAGPAAHEEASTLPAHVAVERPYDTQSSSPLQEASTSKPVPPPRQAATAAASQPPPPAPATVTEEPADFEWRNLKKLIVLVLSSLVWKSPTVQNQIREYGGVETILSCTTYDGS